MYTTWDITLAVGHVPGETLTLTADVLSHYHLGKIIRDRVDVVLKAKRIICIPLSHYLFHLSNDL